MNAYDKLLTEYVYNQQKLQDALRLHNQAKELVLEHFNRSIELHKALALMELQHD